MKSEELDINLAIGAHLSADIKIGNQIFPRGYALTKEDVLVFKMQGITKIYVFWMEDGDIDYQTALGIVSAKLCGNNTAYALDSKGTCQIISTVNGVFINSDDRVGKFNRLHSEIVLNTIEPYSQVKEGDVIARLEMSLPLIPQSEIDDLIFKLSGNSRMLEVSPLSEKKVCFIYARMQNISAENKRFTAQVKRLVKDFKGLQFNFNKEIDAQYNVEAIADALDTALRSDSDVIFILSPLRGAGGKDVIPTAVAKIVDNIACLRMPQIGGSDLLIAEKNNKRIILLPYDYDKLDDTFINRCIKQAAYADKINSFDFSRHQIPNVIGNPTLPEECRSSLVMAGNNTSDGSQANIAAVVLAAGIGSRSGRDKLLSEIEEDVPLFLKAVKAAIASQASPVFVITGYRNEELEAYLEDVDVNIIYNPAYRSGIKTSISLGLKSVPGFCEGAMLLPADMPNITAEDINKLIKVYKRGEEKQVCMFTHNGQKSNPIIWSSSLYGVADIVPENANLRPVFVEHSDYSKYVEITDDDKFFDVTYPADIELLQKKMQESSNKKKKL